MLARTRSRRGAIAAELAIGLVSAAGGVALLRSAARLMAPPAASVSEPARSADPSPPASSSEPPGALPEPEAEPSAEPSAETPEAAAREPTEAEFPARFDDDSALPKPPPPVASYTLTARLDETTHTIFGKGTIRWLNATSRPADELWLHLYLNAFKNERTLFLRSRFVTGRGGVRPRDYGYIDVKKLVARELGNIDVWPRAEPHTPGDRDDQTDIRVALPGSIEPGKLLTLDVEFESKLPSLVERTGFADGFHFAGQWFPKLARREPDGTWVHFPFHPYSEFYADYGRYSVTIDVPERMVVGATGRRVEERVEGGRRRVRHELDTIHDFAWTAWDRFHEHDERIEGVDVRVLFPPGHDRNLRATLEAVRFGLSHFGRRYGRYPYPVLTVVHPPEVAKQAGGMEYPTLITTGGRWFASYLRVRAVESVTLHELGHQWFYGLLGSDEHRWPFLDEGVNSYAEATAAYERWGNGSLVSWPGLEISLPAAYRGYAAGRGRDEPVGKAASAFSSIEDLGALVYGRTATILETLGNVYGKDQLARALGRYARRLRFSHPNPQQLLTAVREVMGSDAEEALRAALFERAWVDYLVSDIEAVPLSEPAGFFEEDAGRKLRPFDEQAEARPARWASRALIHRHGGLHLPVDIELGFEDGSSERKHWDGVADFIAVDHVGNSPIVRATVDPDHKITLDSQLLNNFESTSSNGALRTLERATYLAELWLGWLGS